MKGRSLSFGWWIAVAAVLAGTWLRWDGLSWGLRGDPARLYHPDERRLAAMAVAMDAGAPFSRGYVLAQPQLVRLATSPAAGDLRPGIAAARRISFLAGLGTIALCALLARKLGTPAWFAAALAAANTLCAIHAHFGTADALYALLLCGFSLAVLSGSLFAAAACAGLAMATKFGLVLVPSLLFLAWRHRLRGAAALAVTAAVFVAAQGFAFDAESVRAIWRSFTEDNAGGFVHDKWLNAPVYAAVLVRSIGIPAALLALAGLARCRTLSAPRRELVAAFLPFALHAAGLLAINTAFPRHALPLIPPLLVFAALGLARLPERARSPVAALAVAWSLALAWSDGRVFSRDPREQVADWMAREQPREVAVWTDPFWQGPAAQTPAARPSQARLLVLNEAWTWRFERSEVNPLRAPDAARLYHAEPGDLVWYTRLQDALAAGQIHVVAAAGPTVWLPEQIAYDRAWGSFEKFAGRSVVIDVGGAALSR